MECEYLVYYPKTKSVESYTYPATIPLKDFYYRKLRNVKSCIVSYNTKEISLVIDNYDVVQYCMWEEAFEYFNNRRFGNAGALKSAGRFLFKLFIICAIVSVLAFGAYFAYNMISDNPIRVDPIQVPNPVSSTNPNNLSDYTTTDYDTQTYTWTYKGYSQNYTFRIPNSLYEYYQNEPHTWLDYSSYAMTEHDRSILRPMIDVLEEEGKRRNFTRDENAMNMITFVQSMPYTLDSETTGYEEYPRYPIETLADRGGDCEDSTILAAALLSETGYDVVLLEFSDHAAIGLASSGSLFGSSYLYNGSQYYYVETTTTGWRAGEVPKEYKNQQPDIYPITPAPSITVHLNPSYQNHDSTYVYYKVEYTIVNNSPTPARNVMFQVYTDAEPFEKDRAWDIHRTDIEMLQGGETVHFETVLKAVRKENTRISCIVYGDNFFPVEAQSNVVYVK